MMLFSTTLLIKPPVFSAEGDNELEELEKGMADEAVIELEEDLKELGFTSIEEPTEEFDEDTKQSIKSFQSYFDLEVDGKANEETLNKIDDVLSSPFQEGEYHEETVKLKEMLSTLGYWDTSNVTTLYDSHTETAVQEFQADNDLPQSGIVDEVTLESLEVLVDEPLRNRMRRDDVIPLKEKLEFLGFGSFNMTDLYATQTEQAVRNFQSYYDLNVDGIVGEETSAKLKEIAQATEPFQNGKRHADTVTLKEYLYVLGFWDNKSGTTLYGPQTERAVRSFQESSDLNDSGVADPVTWEVLVEKATAPLQNPMYRDDVIPLKEKLEFLGFGSFNMTDYYGPQTEQAVRDFQRSYGLTVDGIVGDATLQKLDQVANGPLRNRMNRQDVIPLKENLQHLGYGSFNMTDLFASATEAAVRAFQSDYQDYYDLSVNGIADSDTVSALEEIANTPFQNRNRHSETRTLKDYLYVLGFWDSKDGTNLYGNRTEQAVREFQSSNNLLETGIADPITWDILEKKATAPIQNRMYRDDVIPLKEKLELLGFGSFNMTDLFASQTERAVREFQSYYQEYYDLTVSGVVDNKTLGSLEELVNSPFQDENRHEYTETLKDQMYVLGFWDSKNGTNLYGSRTARAIRDFQSAFGLRESGVADPKTQDVLEAEAKGP